MLIWYLDMLACKVFVFFLVITMGCFSLTRFVDSRLVQEEVDALEDIVKTMGSTYWKFDANSCSVETVGVTEVPPKTGNSSIECKCNNENNTDCHVVGITFKGYNLPGVLPSQLNKLPYLRVFDLSYNYLNGTIPIEWSSLQLTSISLLVNRLSGKIPKELGNMSSLTYLCLEANEFSGVVPSQLGKLTNLQTLLLSSNRLTGSLPESLAELNNLTDFRINDNNFSGRIPSFIQKWSKLNRLEMHASGLEGPIPSNISLLSDSVELRISDIKGPQQEFPDLSTMPGLLRLVLRSCNISGEIPTHIWSMKNLQVLDLSFNKLVGQIPSTIPADRLRFIFLTGNLMSGDIPDSILRTGKTVDLSYNNFTFQAPGKLSCQENLNLNLNLFRSSTVMNGSRQVLPCLNTASCPRYVKCLFINSGGKDVIVKENRTSFLYKGDGDIEGGAAKLYLNKENYWGLSSTGDYMDDYDAQNTRYTISLQSSTVPELYLTARKSPISLTYFHYCIQNGMYTMKLHFAEIQFTNDNTFNSLGRRLFDIYVQERLVWKDFDIEREAGGAQKPLVKEVRDVNISNNILEIRFYFAGKGTTRIPDRGVYGPIVSAISVASDFNVCSLVTKKRNAVAIVGGVAGALCLVVIVLGFLWWRGLLPGKCGRRKDHESANGPSGTFSLKQIKVATNDFHSDNKIGEGGFGPVYKGVLPDGTGVAVKQLSSKSSQGNKEFMTEIGMFSCLQHPNLVKLHGFCVEGDQLLLVYEYLENNNLARALFNRENNKLKLDWPTRLKICVGIAKGLAFLHDESRLKIVHRDIKATNVLLDKDLEPKISDFGLARLYEGENTHISTRVAGTIGYMAPEYALWGHLSHKADVYSFGVVVMEIVSGKSNINFIPSNNCVCLLDWAYHLQQTGNLMELVDDTLRSEVNSKEMELMVRVAILCTNASPTVRPTMSEVVSMLEGRTPIPEVSPDSNPTEDLRFKAIRDFRMDSQIRTFTSESSTVAQTFSLPPTTDQDFYEINPGSRPHTYT